MTWYLIISSFLNFLAAGVLAFAVVLRGRKDSINVRFGVFALTIGGWSAGYFLWQLAEDANRALFYARVLMFFAYFVPVAFFHFVAELCGERKPWVVRAGYAVATAFAALNFTPWMVERVAPALTFPFWPRAGRWYWLYLLAFAFFTVQACWLLVRRLRTATGGRATQIRNILLASFVGFSGGATNFPLWYGVRLPPFGNLLVFLYLLIMAYAVSRYQLPLVTHDFAHAAIYLGLAVTISVFYLLALTGLAPLLGYPEGSTPLLSHFLLSLVVTLFFMWAVPRLNRVADRLLTETYLRRRSSRQEQLKRLAQRIVSLGSEQEIYEIAVHDIAEGLGIGSAAIYARGEFDHDYELRAAYGRTRGPRYIPGESVLPRTLLRRRSPILFDGSEFELEPAVLAQLEEQRAQMPFEAAFPVAGDDYLPGLLVLGPRSEGERYSEGELAVLDSVCLQIAVTLRARQIERRASQTEKLIALGTLAAGLAHELRNPLTSIQTFTALLRERTGDADPQVEFAGVVERDVNRIASIVDNVAAFAESNKVEMTAVQIPEILRAATDILRPELERTGIALEMPEVEVPEVRGNNSQLLQVFVNLTQNAIQALEGRPGGRIRIALETRSTDVPEPLVCVSVEDNGPGIDPAMLPRIFEPFTTTKATGDRRGKHGMGLGLAIVKRIVQHHHGDIGAESQTGRGTTFRVHLPQLR